MRSSCCVSQLFMLTNQVGVALNARRGVRGEVGVADDHDAHLRLRRRLRAIGGLSLLPSCRRSAASAAEAGASGASIDSDNAIVIGPR